MPKTRALKVRLDPMALRQSARFPKGSRVLHAREQNDQVYVYILGNPAAKNTEVRRFLLLPDGDDLPDLDGPFSYLGTAVTAGGASTFHVFIDGEQRGRVVVRR